jgi:hypothetical protein
MREYYTVAPFPQAVNHVACGTLPIAVPPLIAALRFQYPNSPSLAQRGDAAFRLASEVIAKRKRLGWLGEAACSESASL